MNISVVEAAVGVLANTMRLYGESQARFVSLFPVDREEAIDNTDRAFEAKLEAVHTLYDVTKGELPWFDAGDTALLIAIRNAIHHRDHPLFPQLLRNALARWQGRAARRRGVPIGEPQVQG